MATKLTKKQAASLLAAYEKQQTDAANAAIAAYNADVDAGVRETEAGIAADRKAQVGTGDRSERIRTYNFPQGRVTDHRIGLTLYKIDSILNGDLDEVVEALITAYRAEQLRQSSDQN